MIAFVVRSLVDVQPGETRNFLSEHEDLLPCVKKRMRKSLTVRLHPDEVIYGEVMKLCIE